ARRAAVKYARDTLVNLLDVIRPARRKKRVPARVMDEAIGSIVQRFGHVCTQGFGERLRDELIPFFGARAEQRFVEGHSDERRDGQDTATRGFEARDTPT